MPSTQKNAAKRLKHLFPEVKVEMAKYVSNLSIFFLNNFYIDRLFCSKSLLSILEWRSMSCTRAHQVESRDF